MGWWLLIIGIVAFNAAASVAIHKRADMSPARPLAQHAFVWLVPVVGAAAVLLFLRSQTIGAATGFDPLYTPSDGGQPHQGWIPSPSDFDGGGDGGSGD